MTKKLDELALDNYPWPQPNSPQEMEHYTTPFKQGFNAGVKAAFSSEQVAGLVEALKVASKLLDEIKFELYGSVYTLTDDEFETTYFVRDECDRALAKWEKRNE